MISNEKIHYSIIMEQTPNPETIKFIINYQLLPFGKVLEFESNSHTEVSPLAKSLFAFPFVKQILIAENYISITKHQFVSWDDILLELRDYLYEYLNSGKQVLNVDLLEKYATDTTQKENEQVIENIAVQHNIPQSEIEQKIIDILNEYIIPAVSQDGGFITFERFENGIVYLKMRGACSGCPSSVLTLKAGIEGLLKKMLPDVVKEVRSEGI